MLTAMQKEVLVAYLDDYDSTMSFEKILFKLKEWDDSVLPKLEYQDMDRGQLVTLMRQMLDLLTS